MLYLRLVGCMLVLLLLVGMSGQSVQAQEVVLPQPAALNSVHEDYLLTFNGVALMTCQRDWASWNRMHGTCEALATVTLPWDDLIAGAVREFVFYDGTIYQRFDQDTTWFTSPDPAYNPNMPLSEGLFGVNFAATLAMVGPTDVNGVAAMQYQYWASDAAYNQANGGQVVYDLFMTADGLVLKDQFNRRGSFAGLGSGELSEIYVYSQFNADITVSPPPTAQ